MYRSKGSVRLWVIIACALCAVVVIATWRLFVKMRTEALVAARSSISSNNMRQIGIAFNVHEQHFRRYPARAILSKDGKPLLSWRVQLLPYIDEKALYAQFHLDEPWDSEHNKKLISYMPDVYKSPQFTDMEGKTCYVVPVGKGTIFGTDTSLNPRAITDGERNTIMFVEVAPEKSVFWTKPDEMDYNPDKPFDGIGQPMAGFFKICCVDASVHRIPLTTDPSVLRAMFTYSGQDPVTIPDSF